VIASEIERVTEPGITKNHANAEGETAKLTPKISTLTKKFLSILIFSKTSSPKNKNAIATMAPAP
jgi:hypothetical protein